MTKQEHASYEDSIRRSLRGTVSRAQLLAVGGASLAALAAPRAAAAADSTGSAHGLEFPFFPHVKGTYTTEGIQDILNLLETFEMFLVTTNAYALTDLGSQLKEPALSFRQARGVIGQYHIDLLESLGAHPLLTTFTPRNRVTPSTPIGNQEGDAAGMVGAYMTAVREFAELGQPLLAKYAFQAGATWAELRGVVRSLGGLTPSLNKAFETDYFLYLRDFYKGAVEAKQFENSGVSLSGLRLTYPGRAAVLAASGTLANAVIEKTPNNVGETP